MSNPEIDEDGNKFWCVNGKPHRIDGPAVEFANGNKYWYANGNLHRLDGPAVEGRYGTKEWWVNGERHRLDGPAIEYTSETKRWYVNGKELSGPLYLLKHGAKIEDIAEYLTPREIALCRIQK